MTKKEITNLSASIFNKLFALARKEGRDFNDVLMRYLQERFLYRLSVSDYKNKFILKGGFMLTVIDLPASRPTMDIDFAAKQIKNDIAGVEAAFKEICAVKTAEDDAVIFDATSIKGESIMEATDYNGIRIKLKAKLGNSITPMKFDVGFGDVITPKTRTAALPAMLGLPQPILSIYPLETVIAEKLSAMAEHSLTNSRMKDFYDVYMILTKFDLKLDTLKTAINKTFENRGIALSKDFVIFKEDFYKTKQAQWELFLNNNKLNEADINNFEKVIKTIQKHLGTIL